MYFFDSARGPRARESQGIVVSRIGHFGFFQIGGPVEESGRLNYIEALQPILF